MIHLSTPKDIIASKTIKNVANAQKLGLFHEIYEVV